MGYSTTDDVKSLRQQGSKLARQVLNATGADRKKFLDELISLQNRWPQGVPVSSEITDAIAIAQSQSSESGAAIALSGAAFTNAVYTHMMNPHQQAFFIQTFDPNEYYNILPVNADGSVGTALLPTIKGDAMREHYATLIFHAGSHEQQRATGISYQPGSREHKEAIKKLFDSLQALEGWHAHETKKNSEAGLFKDIIRNNHHYFEKAHKAGHNLINVPADEHEMPHMDLKAGLQVILELITSKHRGMHLGDGSYLSTDSTFTPTTLPLNVRPPSDSKKTTSSITD